MRTEVTEVDGRLDVLSALKIMKKVGATSLIVKRRQIILTNLEQLAAVLDELTPEVERLIQTSAQRAGRSPNQTQQPFAKRRIPE